MSELNKYQACLRRLNLNRSEDALIAHLCEKKLRFHHGESEWTDYPVSFSARPRSCQENSLGTPWGLHEIAEKHGAGAPLGMIFVGRQPTGEIWQERSGTDSLKKCLVTTRILRLRGLEPGLNSGPGCDSYDRYIYIHGTNHPEKFPKNISAGCLLMRDEDLLELFDRIQIGTHVWLGEAEETHLAH